MTCEVFIVYFNFLCKFYWCMVSDLSDILVPALFFIIKLCMWGWATFTKMPTFKKSLKGALLLYTVYENAASSREPVSQTTLTKQCKLFKTSTSGHRWVVLNGCGALLYLTRLTITYPSNSWLVGGQMCLFTCLWDSSYAHQWYSSLICSLWHNISAAPKRKNALKLMFIHYGLWQVCLNVCRLHQLVLTRSLLEQMLM